MYCLINFLSDNNQKSIINMIQNRDETFEKEIDSYKKLFLVQLKYCLGENGEPCHNKDCICRDACNAIKETIRSIHNEENEIEYFFNGIQNCYKNWIDSNISNALDNFEELLKKYNIIYSEMDGPNLENDRLLLKDIEHRVFFRARMSDEYLCKKEIFHIPFNKRCNIRNERFSLTGQPLLYLGNSIADLSEEINFNINRDDIKRLRVSSFEFIHGKEPNKIFDLRCSIRNDLIDPDGFNKPAFFRNILSEICSFQKRKELEGSAFKEEYVIPQMLSIILKKNNYNGICYYSTKKFIGYELSGVGTDISECDKSMQYRENLALFTTQKEPNQSDLSTYIENSNIYDADLFNSLDISIPIAINNVKLCSEHELYKLEEMVRSRYDNIKSTPTNSKEMIDAAKQSKEKATAVVNFFRKVFHNLTINGISYHETELGRIHIQLLVGILNKLLVDSTLKDAHLSK